MCLYVSMQSLQISHNVCVSLSLLFGKIGMLNHLETPLKKIIIIIIMAIEVHERCLLLPLPYVAPPLLQCFTQHNNSTRFHFSKQYHFFALKGGFSFFHN
jgi:hypothetical protein